MKTARHEFVTFIASTPEKVWNALIDPAETRKYWQHENRSDWKPGSRWEHYDPYGEQSIDLVGKVAEFTPPSRMVLTWAFAEDEGREGAHSRVTFTVEPCRGVVRLAVAHEKLEPGSEMEEGIVDGWPKVLSSLKTLLETGAPLPKLW